MYLKIIALAAFSLSAFQAHASQLSSQQITSVISGKKVVLSTSFGSFPLRYRANKTVSGDGSGVGLAKFFKPKETGKWWVKNDRLCQQFPTWYKGKPLCFTLSQTGNDSLRWVRQDGYSGTAKIQ